MMILLYHNTPLKYIILSLLMVYCVFKNLLRRICDVINIIRSEVVIIQGYVSLPDIALHLTNLALCPIRRIYKYGSRITSNCSLVSQV